MRLGMTLDKVALAMRCAHFPFVSFQDWNRKLAEGEIRVCRVRNTAIRSLVQSRREEQIDGGPREDS